MLSDRRLGPDLERLPAAEKARLYWKLGMALIVDREEGFVYEATSRSDLSQEAKRYLTLSLALRGAGPSAVMCHLLLGSLAAHGTKGVGPTEDRLNEFDAAKAIIDGDASLADLWPQYHYWRAKALGDLDRRSEAREELAKAFVRVPQDDTRQRSLFLLEQASMSTDLGVEEVSKVLSQLSPADARTLARAQLLLGLAYFEELTHLQGKPEFRAFASKTETVLSKAADLGAPGTKVHMLLGSVAFMNLERERARTHFLEWLRRAPDDLLANYWVARSLLAAYLTPV